MAEFSLGIQTLAFLIAMVEFIVALYVLLDWRRRAHLAFAAGLIILAVNTFALGRLEAVSGEDESFLPALMLAISGPLIVPMILAAFIALVGPTWQRRRWMRGSLWIIFVIAAIPFVLTTIDLVRLQARLEGASLWFTPLGPRYPGGFVDKSTYTAGILSTPVNGLVYAGLGIPLLVLALITLLRRDTRPALRGFAALVLLSQSFGILPNIIAFPPQAAWIFNLLASVLFLLTIAITAFQSQGVEEQADSPGQIVPGGGSLSLQNRLTLLALIITLPLLASMGILLTDQARGALEKNAVASLASIDRNIVDSSEIWLANNSRTLRLLASNPDIQSMDPARQEPALVDLVSIYPDINLVSVIGMNGKSISSSDGKESGDFSQERWFQQAKDGLPVSFAVRPASVSESPTITAAAPVRNQKGDVIAVVMFSSQLTLVQRLVNAQNTLAAGASVMIVDENNQLVASTDPQARLMTDQNHLLTVQALRSGKLGSYRYLDSRGDYWNANLNVLSNDWGIIVLQPERSLFAPIRNFQRVSVAVLAIGSLILLLLTWSTIRKALVPVRNLTRMATAIAAGDLSQKAPVYDQNELGLLAQAFNNMTDQLRELITSLEMRVSERTRDLERRAVQLQVTAEVAREAAAIHNPDQLLQDATRLISERFGHYHAGIFLIEASGGRGLSGALASGYAVLRATSSEGGQRMLQRSHRLAVASRAGEGQGIVGYVAGTGEPRIALDVGKEPVYFNNPDLPMTRSEMAVPLKIQDRVVGVIDVQSRKPAAFDDQDVAILQVLADQLAIALQNAELLAESRQALSELENLYGLQVQQSWQKRLGDQALIYKLAAGQVSQVDSKQDVLAKETLSSPDSSDPRVIEAPIEIRSARLGTLRIRRAASQDGWTVHDRELVEQTVGRLAQALENARLVEEIQNRARQEEQINQIVTRTQRTLNLDSVLRTAVEEIVQAVNASRVQLRLHPLNERNGNVKDGHEGFKSFPATENRNSTAAEQDDQADNSPQSRGDQ